MLGSLETQLSGWGGFRPAQCRLWQPVTRAGQRTVLTGGSESTYIARGLGRSYGDSAVNAGGGVISQAGLNRFLKFDAESGLVECEAGVSLEDIINVALPRGWFLPTTPGTRFVTVGGAIAADVHGKNHHCDGSFGNFVRSLTLLVPGGEVLTCSPQENAELFWATVAGMGLTGIIVTAQVQLVPVESCYCSVTYHRTKNLAETLEYFDATGEDFRYSVSWVDCLARGDSLGRGVVMQANDAPLSALPSRLQHCPLELPSKFTKSVPMNFPGFALNTLSVKAFNELYYRRHGDREELVDYYSYFYPLDSILHWNRMYGRRGFVQYQAFFPRETSHAGLTELLELVAQSGQASFLAVLKSCGEASKGLLTYLEPGHTLALDLPNTGAKLDKLAAQLDEVLLRHRGKLYMAKDALASAETFARMYERLDEFRRIKRDIDPQNRLVSSQARRLGIVETA